MIIRFFWQITINRHTFLDLIKLDFFLCFSLQQVELMPGSGVYIKRATYNQLQFIDKGSKLVRKLVREIFPDVHLLASSSCMGKGETSAGLDRHKVEVIKGVYWNLIFDN